MYDEYYYTVDIEYNKEFLYDICVDITHWPMYSNDRGKTLFSTHRDIVFPVNIEAYRIKNKLLTTTTFSFSYVPPGHDTGWHTDFTRGCTLICPIDPNPHLIRFRKDDGSEFDYWYTGPILTNAKTLHNGMNPTDHPRFNMLFHIDASYKEVLKMIKEDRFITKWKQDYNICQLYDSPMVNKFFDTHSDVESCSILVTDNYKIATSNASKFIIFIGEYTGEFTTITPTRTTKERDICQAIKYVLDSPVKIKNIVLGE